MLWITFFTILISTAGAQIREGVPIFLEVGEQRILSFNTLERYSVSGDAIRYLRPTGRNELLIKAIKPGRATLFLTTREYGNQTHLVQVERKKNSPYPSTLFQALHSIQTTEVIDQGNHLILRGEVRNRTEATTIADVRSRFREWIIDETTIEPRWFLECKRSLELLLTNYPELTLNAAHGEFLVTGGVSHPTFRDQVIKKIKAIQPLTTIEISTVSGSDPTLYFKVFLLEVKKEWMSRIGVQWTTEHPAALNLTTTQFLLSDSIDLTIHALSEQGLARVLSSPELVVKAPGQAELFAGGELPIQQQSRFASSIIWKNVGLSLKLDVKEFGGDKVRLSIETEMSSLDQALAIGKVPGVKTNRIKTLVDGQLGRPLLLSGLLQEDLYENSRGFPGLSSIPVLGKLFSSQDFQNKRSELVAILLPHRNIPSHPMSRIDRETPKGYLPLPRNFMSTDEVERAKKSPAFPWNVL